MELIRVSLSITFKIMPHNIYYHYFNRQSRLNLDFVTNRYEHNLTNYIISCFFIPASMFVPIYNVGFFLFKKFRCVI